MMNTKTFTITNIDGSTTEMVEIDNGNGSFTQMPRQPTKPHLQPTQPRHRRRFASLAP